MYMSSSDLLTELSIKQEQDYWKVVFTAMACPCEILIRSDSPPEIEELASAALTETRRIEQKFSRYRKDNIVYAINNADGQPVPIDDETGQLLDYAGNCYQLSEGLFDITSGILRRAWTFKGEKVRPDQKQIDTLLKLVSWEKVRLTPGQIILEPGMEIDFGGIGKEYAVDKVSQLLFQMSGLPAMVNFGGDIMIVGSDHQDKPWCIGIADPERPDYPLGFIELFKGAVTTSGVSYRHCFVNGKRLGHVLNPRTGWPVTDAPRSVTVVANFCLEAGMLSTMAMLYGKDAELFLKRQQVQFHCIW
jgi:thiamine biosynthesis lipoprotein